VIETEAQVRTVPAWVGILIIALCMGGAGWFGWWYWNSEPHKGEIVALNPSAANASQPPNINRRGGGGANRNQPGRGLIRGNTTPDGITTVGNNANSWQVSSGTAYMRTNMGQNNQFRFSYGYNDNSMYTTVLRMRDRIINEQAVAKEVKVSPEQIEALKKLAGRTRMMLSDSDRDKLQALWTSYSAATDPTAKTAFEKQLITTLAEVGRNSERATRDAIAAREKEIAAVLTSEQLAAYNNMGKN
jgi:hypothetical protein